MTPMPEPRTIEAALGLTARRLAIELLQPTDEAPDWNAFEWRTAMAVSAIHGISVLLANSLRWTGPPVWQAFLAQQQQQGQQREQRITELLDRLNEAARRDGLSMVGLKGSALRRLDLYAAGERAMGDVDLLVRDADFDKAAELISGLGYVGGPPDSRHLTFMPLNAASTVQLGEHADNPIRIELHPRVAERLLFDPVDITARLWQPDPRPGLQPYPSTTALMQHLLLHAAGNISAHRLRLLQLEDIARLSANWPAALWAEVLADSGDGPPWWALPALQLAARHQRLTLPAALLEPLERACPRRLLRAMRHATIADVSCVQARVLAFPGIEWTRSTAEALHLMYMRARPNAEMRRMRQTGEFDHPSTRASPAASMSQLRRALYWLVERPLRPITVHSLQLALDYEAP